MTIEAVVFDMDGLMFDTERISQRAWGIAGRECGIENGEELVYSALGRSSSEIKEILTQLCGADFPYERFYRRKIQVMDEAISRDGLPVKPGLIELLRYLKKTGLRAAVATSTIKSRAMSYFKMAGVTDYFDVIATGDMVSRGKPHPDVFLKACEMLGIAPQRCLALEDSFNGIRAAHAGGLIPIMIPDLVEPDEQILPLLEQKLGSLYEVIEFLQRRRYPKTAQSAKQSAL